MNGINCSYARCCCPSTKGLAETGWCFPLLRGKGDDPHIYTNYYWIYFSRITPVSLLTPRVKWRAQLSLVLLQKNAYVIMFLSYELFWPWINYRLICGRVSHQTRVLSFERGYAFVLFFRHVIAFKITCASMIYEEDNIVPWCLLAGEIVETALTIGVYIMSKMETDPGSGWTVALVVVEMITES